MKTLNKFTLGLIINPISGMGGTVGLKGTDGRETLLKAIELGAQPNATNRARELLKELESIRSRLRFLTCPGIMGENVLKEMNFEYTCINHQIFSRMENLLDTTPKHTEIASEIMKNNSDLNLLLFVGGDGTARNIVNTLGVHKPCLGIPAGVKIFSSVFSLNPRKASLIIIQFLYSEIPVKKMEVLDIDENEYRKGNLVSKFYGYLMTPYDPDLSQTYKIGTPASDLNNQERIAKRVIEILKHGIYYLLGPGTTVKTITEYLNQEKTLLGIDVLLNNRVIAQDLNERQIIDLIKKKKAKIIISLIGHQGFLFGRGNLQFSSKVLKMINPKDIIIISTKFKLLNIPKQILRIDTRDIELDKKLKGLYKVIVDYDEMRICKVE
ncbi:MAG: ATP-NAD kinase family protein [Candidatus Hodarchaeota archaeon]